MFVFLNQSIMGKLKILQTLIDITYFFLLVIVVVVLFVAPDLLKGTDVFSLKILFICNLISAMSFVYGVYALRTTLVYFKNRDFFNVKVISSFSIVGKCLVASSLIEIPVFFYDQNKNNSIMALTLLLCMGLFFMVLSEVFKIAKEAKEENELTV